MEKIQFFFSVFFTVSLTGYFLKTLFTYTNQNVMITTILLLSCYLSFQLVKICYKELKAKEL